MAKIKLTETMAHALVMTRKTSHGFTPSERSSRQTLAALVRRGLLTGDRLTDAGETLRRYLIAGGETREFDPTQLWSGGFPLDRAGDRCRARIQLDSDQEKRAALFPAGTSVRCLAGSNKGRLGVVLKSEPGDGWTGVVRDGHPNAGLRFTGVEWEPVAGDMGANRVSRPFVDELEAVVPETCGAVDGQDLDACGQCSDCDAGRMSLEEALAEAYPEPRRITLEEHNQDASRMTLEEALSDAYPAPAPGVKVTVLYADGTEEIVSNIPTDTIAVGIYTEATYNDRVRKAVLYRADGTEARVYTNTVLVCGRQIDPRQIINETRYTGQLCSRERGHRGRHRVSTGSGTDRDNIHWDDDACLPLDPGH